MFSQGTSPALSKDISSFVVTLWALLSSVFTGPVQETKNTWPCPCPPFSPKRQPHNQKVRDDPGHQPILAPMQELDRTWKKT